MLITNHRQDFIHCLKHSLPSVGSVFFLCMKIIVCHGFWATQMWHRNEWARLPPLKNWLLSSANTLKPLQLFFPWSLRKFELSNTTTLSFLSTLLAVVKGTPSPPDDTAAALLQTWSLLVKKWHRTLTADRYYLTI